MAFESIDDLENWAIANKDLGLVNGQPVFSTKSKEIQSALVPKHLYDRVLLIASAKGISKTDAGKFALSNYGEAIASERGLEFVELYLKDILEVPEIHFNRNFRFYAPVELIPPAMDLLPLSVFTTLILALWVAREWTATEKKIRARAEDLGISFEECCDKIWDSWLINQRKKRLQLSKEKGSLVTDPKLP